MKRSKLLLENLLEAKTRECDRLYNNLKINDEVINELKLRVDSKENLINILREQYNKQVEIADSRANDINDFERRAEAFKKSIAEMGDVIANRDWDIKRLTQQRDALLFSLQVLHGKSRDMQTIIRKTRIDSTGTKEDEFKLLDEVRLAV